ncbi:MAG TPA: energy-coupling factor transporter transmembrane component T, partial [Candidatus Saccharimonadales bacterium]|nr:energy-coupling factor transporter transmembrane component T [Candidatus Saccharimonadales bacterium]
GRAAPRAGWVSRLDPRARLLVLLVLLLGIPMAGSPAALVALLLAGLGLPRALGLPRGFTRSLLRLAALPLIFTLLVNAAYGPGAGLAPKPSLAGLAAGGLRALQLWLTWMCFSLFWAVTSPDELLRALRVSGAGGPRGWQDFTLTVELALRMMPLVGEEAERVVLAQSARGMEWGGNLARRAGQALALAVPVLHSALRRAEALADLLVARGFGSGPATSAVGYRWAWRDTGAVLAAAGLMAGLALLGRPA